jgi:hypothetical protein
MKTALLPTTLVLFLSAVCLLVQSLCAQDATAPQKPTPHAFTKDTIIYISDFELDAENVNVDKGGVVSQVRPGILERPSKREKHDPEAQATKIVDLMSKSIADNLQKAGYKAQRLPTGAARPAIGAWIHGVFTAVDEGNQRRRAFIGFGAGAANMDLYVTLTDLANPDNLFTTKPRTRIVAKRLAQ